MPTGMESDNTLSEIIDSFRLCQPSLTTDSRSFSQRKILFDSDNSPLQPLDNDIFEWLSNT